MKFNEYIEMLLEQNMNESRRIDREAKKDGSGISRIPGDEYAYKKAYVIKNKLESFDKSIYTFDIIKEFKNLMKFLKTLRKIVDEMPRHADADSVDSRRVMNSLQILDMELDDNQHDISKFSELIGVFGNKVEDRLENDGWSPDFIEIIKDFISGEYTQVGLRRAIESFGGEAFYDEFISTSFYKSVMKYRALADKFKVLDGHMDKIKKYKKDRRDIEKLKKALADSEAVADRLYVDILGHK